jgi:glucosamine--fructose-6-phosphate aminotransferase (isomerizing)
MCGIIGYIGPRPAVPLLLDGLRRLEYRGYDSAGIAVVRDGRVELRRSAGKLSRLEDVIKADPIQGSFGLGHTRWATHGRPTEENAHPHRDCTGRLVIVHNGIIENYLELKQELQRDGHTFVTETDTEVVAHLVEREMRPSVPLDEAVRRSLKRLRGMYALVVLSADAPDTLVAVRNGPPLVVGIGSGESFVASDIPPILAHTRDVVFLADEEMALVTSSGVTFSRFDGTALDRASQRILWDPVQAEKAGYKHFMLKEIYEQPAAVRDTILGRVSPESGRVFLNEINLTDAELARVERVTVLACGTSWHAGLVGKFLIEELAHLPVEVDYGSEFRYRNPVIDERSLAVVITQSGETADTLAALREAKRKGVRAVAVCNVVGSMATREADGTIYTHAGPEIGVASTKAFSSQLVALYLLALNLAQARGALALPEARAHVEGLLRLPQILEWTLKASAGIEDIAKSFHQRRDFLYIGRGINYPVALEGALKLKEISYIHAEGYPAGEMKHGPIALIDEQLPVVAIAPRDHVFQKMLGNIQEVKARGGSVIAITNGSDEGVRDLLTPATDYLVTLPTVCRLLTPVVFVLPLQLLAYHIAVRRGADVDQPRNLAKSVTVE